MLLDLTVLRPFVVMKLINGSYPEFSGCWFELFDRSLKFNAWLGCLNHDFLKSIMGKGII